MGIRQDFLVLTILTKTLFVLVCRSFPIYISEDRVPRFIIHSAIPIGKSYRAILLSQPHGLNNRTYFWEVFWMVFGTVLWGLREVWTWMAFLGVGGAACLQHTVQS